MMPWHSISYQGGIIYAEYIISTQMLLSNQNLKESYSGVRCENAL